VDILELNEISTWSINEDWTGEWWIESPDGQAWCLVTDGGEPRTYRDALEGIAEAHNAHDLDENPRPYLGWSLTCNRCEVTQ